MARTSYAMAQNVKLAAPACVGDIEILNFSFLAFVEELDIRRILEESAELGERGVIETELAALQGKLSEIEVFMENVFGALAAGGPVDFLTAKLNELDKRKSELKQRILEKTVAQQELLSREARYRSSKEEIAQLVTQLQNPSIKDLYKLRAQIASRLKHLIGNILIASVGDLPRLKRNYAWVRSQNKWTDDFAVMEQRDEELPLNRQRYFAVSFHGPDRRLRMVFPQDHDPLVLRQQFLVPMADTLELLDDSSPTPRHHPFINTERDPQT